MKKKANKKIKEIHKELFQLWMMKKKNLLNEEKLKKN